MPKAYVSKPFGLRETSQIRDRNTRQAEDGIDCIELQGIHHKMKSVGDGGRIHFAPHVKHLSMRKTLDRYAPGPCQGGTEPDLCDGVERPVLAGHPLFDLSKDIEDARLPRASGGIGRIVGPFRPADRLASRAPILLLDGEVDVGVRVGLPAFALEYPAGLPSAARVAAARDC